MSQNPWLTRRRFLGLTGMGMVGMGLYSGEIARHELDVVQQTVKIPRLPETFHGYRIVQISDLHYREFTEAFFLRRVLRRVNELKPDAVLITGDFVSMGPFDNEYGIQSAYECAEILREIECPQRYGVLGNHDYNVGEAPVRQALTRALPIMMNEAVAIERDGKRLWVAGLRDCLSADSNLEAALPKSARAANEPVVLMAHEPDYIDTLITQPASRYVDLVLSGHTHGGQVRIPFMRAFPSVLPPMGKKYVEGLFRFANMQLYVNRGVGTTGVPFRLNCDPEITVITLQKE